MQQALFPAEHKQTRNRRHRIPKSRRDRRAPDPHVKQADKHIVEHHVQDAARHRADQGQCCLLARDHVEREIVHQQDRHGKYQITAQIPDTVSLHIGRQIHAGKDMIHRKIPDRTHHNPNKHVYEDQKCEVLPRLVGFVLAHLLHDDRAASGGEHSRDRRDKLYDGRCQIDRRERVRADQIRHKQPVHHRVKRHKHRHRDRRHGKFQNICECHRFFISI